MTMVKPSPMSSMVSAICLRLCSRSHFASSLSVDCVRLRRLRKTLVNSRRTECLYKRTVTREPARHSSMDCSAVC